MNASRVDLCFALSNLALILGAALVLLGTLGAVRFGTIRDRLSDERIVHAQTEAARANEGAEKAKAVAAKANQAAELERLERVKLEERLAPRRLSEQQHTAIIEKLKPEPFSTAVFSVSNAFEPTSFAEQLSQTFEQAGWTVNRYPVTFGVAYSLIGVGIMAGNGEIYRKKAALIYSAFAEAGIAVTMLVHPTLDVGSISIRIGDRN